MNALYGYALAAALLLASLCGWLGYYYGGKHADAEAELAMAAHIALDRQAELDATEAAREAEQKLAEALAGASDAYEKGKRDAQAESERVVDELRTGALRMRDRWLGCEAVRVSVPAAAAGEPDAGARDREESASRIVRAAAEADAQIRGLQQLLRLEREQASDASSRR